MQIDEQLQLCGGVGAYGLGEVAWSPSSRFLLLYRRVGGNPRRGRFGVDAQYYRYDLVIREDQLLGPAEISPDGNEIAASEVWVDDQWWFFPHSLILWSTDGELLAIYKTQFQEGSWGYHRIAWSPQAANLAYVETECPKHKKCFSALYLVNGTNKQRETLIEGWQPPIEAVEWAAPDQLLLTDALSAQWRFNLLEGAMEKVEG